MAIEIRELHIKASVQAGVAKNNEAAASTITKPAQDEGNSEHLIDLCIEKILEILKEKKER